MAGDDKDKVDGMAESKDRGKDRSGKVELLESKFEPLDIARVRSSFPALSLAVPGEEGKDEEKEEAEGHGKDDGGPRHFIFADNAGGSQMAGQVLPLITDYLVNCNVQLGGSYHHSQVAALKVSQGHRAAQTIINASEVDEVIIGPNGTQLTENLARAMERSVSPGDEIIVTDLDHETNIGPWVRLAARKQAKLKFWNADKESFELPLDSLKGMLSKRTRLVAFTHCSNVIGSITPVQKIVKMIREHAGDRCEICVDGTAYAPHRRIDVQKLGVDYYFFSLYKLYGPHISILYARGQAQDGLDSLGHYFFDPKTRGETKLCPGGSNYELTASVPGVLDYLVSLAPTSLSNASDGEKLDAAFERIALAEQTLLEPLMAWLSSEKAKEVGIQLYGRQTHSALVRVPTVSFRHSKMLPSAMVDILENTGRVGLKKGHFYAHRLIKDVMGLGGSRRKDKGEPDDTPGSDKDDLDLESINEGVVRISLVHYNTKEEVEWLTRILDSISQC